MSNNRMGKSYDIIDELLESNDPEVLIKLAQNPTLSEDQFAWIALHSDVRIKAAVVSNTKCPEWILEEFAMYNNYTIRQLIAYNANTPIETLQALRLDANVDVKLAAEQMLAWKQKVAKETQPPADVMA